MINRWNRVYAIDTETHMIPEHGKVRLSATPPELVAVGGCWCRPPMEDMITPDPHVDQWEHTNLDGLADHIRDADWVVFHNAAFDIGVLALAREDLRVALEAKLSRGRVLDTKVLYQFLDPELTRRATLQNLAKTYCGIELEKGDVRTSFHISKPVTEEQWAYLNQDVIATSRLVGSLVTLLNQLGPGGAAPVSGWRREVNACGLGQEQTLASTIRDYCAAAGWQALNLSRNPLFLDRQNLDEAHKETTRVLSEKAQLLAQAGLATFVKASGAIPRDMRGAEIEDLECEVRPSALRVRRWTPVPTCDFLYRFCGSGRYERVDGRWKLEQKKLRQLFLQVAIDNDIGNLPTSPKTGKLSLKYNFWKQHRAILPEPLRLYLDYAKAAKIESAFLNPLLGLEDGARIYPIYWIPGCETFRWSCSNTNTQQLPKKLRKLYRVTAENTGGVVFVGADYASLELYTLAQVALNLGFKGRLLETLGQGGDLHTATAALMFDKPPEAIDHDTERQAAKVANFSLSGGMGLRTFMAQARAVGLPWDQARTAEVMDLWFKAYPEIRAYLCTFKVHPMAFCPKHLDSYDFVRQLGFNPDKGWPSAWDLRERMNEGKWFECTLPSGRMVPNRRFTQAANCFFQGTGADVITRAFLKCCFYGMTVRAVVHDSILVSTTVSQAQRVGEDLIRHMADALIEVCPDVPRPTLEYEVSTHLF
jgi:hypothetical protein